ncbi:MAG: PAS domain-containing protein [Alphaproteobacteria bacterium]|nr:PAS domain-containing protein [Alphaproteobacteria bacterium]
MGTEFDRITWSPNTGPANIAILDEDGRIRDCNEAWRRFASDNGYRGGGCGIGEDYVAVCRTAGGAWSDGAQHVADALDRLLAGEISVFTFEYPCHAPGEERWFELIAVRDPEREVGRVIVMHQPITGRKQAERALALAREMAEHSSASKTRFLTAASHDLRQPLQAAQLYYHLLPAGAEEREPQSVYARLGQTLDAMQNMLDTLLEIGRIDAGLVRPKTEAVALAPVLAGLDRRFRPTAENQGLLFRTVPSSAVVVSDAPLLTHILDAVISNAVRFTDSGTILTGCRRRGQMMAIQVWDTGIGIGDEQRRMIFEEFAHGAPRNADARKGLGLGLAIVNRLCRLLGHGLDVRSSPGQGTLVEITVPRAPQVRIPVNPVLSAFPAPLAGRRSSG